MDEPTAFSVKPTLTGQRVLLRPFTSDDIEAMGPILADPEVARLTGSVRSSAEAQGRSPVLDDPGRRWYASRADQHDRLDLAVVDLASGACVGEVVLNHWEPEDQTCNFRTLLGAAGRGRGLGTEATALLLEHAFTATDLHRIELEVFSFNPRAQRMYERVGFRVEGRRREAFVFDGERLDVVLMAVLRTEWQQPPLNHRQV